jgi:catechol 2,3-dioxygenase-like lactoylglutathione lyase family enzyme
MQLIDHVSISVRNIVAAKHFYTAVFAALGVGIVHERDDAIGYGERNRPGNDAHSYLSIYQSGEAIPDARRHWCFRAQSQAQVAAFHAAGLTAGGKDAGSPGLRSYHAHYYAAFLFDPDGNKVEAVYHGSEA